ncbi:hypothetical protein [Piscinibacterium candidicorallinum]|uniref:DUF1049 domain-containing protein n=1 Tax=Piscinibacterium candidicorallinum TaxID=1793872 RepID=A0ABV7H4E1_9BURK
MTDREQPAGSKLTRILLMLIGATVALMVIQNVELLINGVRYFTESGVKLVFSVIKVPFVGAAGLLELALEVLLFGLVMLILFAPVWVVMLVMRRRKRLHARADLPKETQ